MREAATPIPDFPLAELDEMCASMQAKLQVAELDEAVRAAGRQDEPNSIGKLEDLLLASGPPQPGILDEKLVGDVSSVILQRIVDSKKEGNDVLDRLTALDKLLAH
eukprot:742311-Alexandrium_andersonii.AAC.1